MCTARLPDGSDSRDVMLVTLHHRYLRAEGAARVAAEAALVGEIEAGVWGCCLGGGLFRIKYGGKFG